MNGMDNVEARWRLRVGAALISFSGQLVLSRLLSFTQNQSSQWPVKCNGQGRWSAWRQSSLWKAAVVRLPLRKLHQGHAWSYYRSCRAAPLRPGIPWPINCEAEPVSILRQTARLDHSSRLGTIISSNTALYNLSSGFIANVASSGNFRVALLALLLQRTSVQ